MQNHVRKEKKIIQNYKSNLLWPRGNLASLLTETPNAPLLQGEKRGLLVDDS